MVVGWMNVLAYIYYVDGTDYCISSTYSKFMSIRDFPCKFLFMQIFAVQSDLICAKYIEMKFYC